MARKKGGLNPEVQDDGGLFGDQMLVYEDDLKKAEETPARKKSAGGRGGKGICRSTRSDASASRG